jgi:hypothetical protein
VEGTPCLEAAGVGGGSRREFCAGHGRSSQGQSIDGRRPRILTGA